MKYIFILCLAWMAFSSCSPVAPSVSKITTTQPAPSPTTESQGDKSGDTTPALVRFHTQVVDAKRADALNGVTASSEKAPARLDLASADIAQFKKDKSLQFKLNSEKLPSAFSLYVVVKTNDKQKIYEELSDFELDLAPVGNVADNVWQISLPASNNSKLNEAVLNELTSISVSAN